MTIETEAWREQLASTTIDPATLLSTDYFNSFNDIIMTLGMLADLPELIDEVRSWVFNDYEQHFAASGLPFAVLAVTAYHHAPASVREPFDDTIQVMREIAETARSELSDASTKEGPEALGAIAAMYSQQLQSLVEAGSAIIHGAECSSAQNAIDDLF
jgi:hypothetical protein